MASPRGEKVPTVPPAHSDDADFPTERLRQAQELHRRGMGSDAEKLCEAVLRQHSTHFGALHLAGVIALQTGRTARGLALLGQAVELQPENADAHRDFGSALFASNRLEEALASFARAIALKPDNAEALYNRGLTLSHLGRYETALSSYDRAIVLQPRQPLLHNSRASTLFRLRRYEEALAGYDEAIALRPDHAEAYSNRALALSNLLRYEEALTSCDRALALQPDHAGAHCSRGVVLTRLQRHADALASFERAIALNPDDHEAHSGRAIVLADLHRHVDALASFDRAIALRPKHADAYWYKSLCLLALGQFERGWALHEWRKRRDQPLGGRAFPRPVWLGDTDIAGKTLFIHWEQGLGDTIQFCRYATLAKVRGARVVMSVQDPLRRLLGTLGSDIDLIGGGEVPAEFDCHCPMMSLPLAFGTRLETIPNQIPYLAADQAAVVRWRSRLAALPGPRIGLLWAGAQGRDHPAAHAIDQRRSITLARYAPLARVSGASFVSLQTGEPAAQATAPPAGLSLSDWTDELTDFADTAALIVALDLVITVDTAVAHLAGALGKTVWVLTRFDACWRWLTGRDDSPWYPTARLWRQPKPGDWDSVVAAVAAALQERVTHGSDGTAA
jgi:tetratricopeptide (TPR) repeat protein